jgi:hypothetical protein
MAKIVFLPTNGMNDKDFVIEQNKMTEIINMEVKEAGQLEKRIEQQTFSSNLNTAIGTIFATVLPVICPDPFYPARIPDVMYASADYMIPVYGITATGDYLLYVFYETASGVWGSTKIDLESSGIEYSASSNIIIKYIRDLLLVLDYDGDNEPHYLTINEDKEIVYDLLKNSVARPDKAPSFSDIDGDTNRGNIFTSEESDGFSSPKLFRWFYTIVNIFADEGNPSPASLVYDLGYHSEDTDGIQQQWIEGVLLGGLSLPIGATDKMKDEADKYRIYRQECNDASSYVFTQPQFVAEIDVLDKDGDTSYLDTITVGAASSLLSFINNRAPIARDAELVGESIMLSKLKLRIEIIAAFDKIHEFKITNPNSETYPNGITRIRLDYSTPSTGFPDLSWLIAHKDKMRLFDSDLASPIPVVYDDTLIASNIIDIYARIPFLEAGQQRKLYFAYCLSTTLTAGVTALTHWQDCGEYGEFQNYEESAQWALQKVWSEQASRNNSLICAPTTLIDNSSRVMNKSNELNYGDLNNASWDSTAIDGHNIPILINSSTDPRCPNAKSLKLSAIDGYAKFFDSTIFEELTMPGRLTYMFRVQYGSAGLTSTTSGQYNKDIIAGIIKDANEFIVVYRDYSGCLGYRVEGDGTHDDDPLTLLKMATAGSYFVGISINHPQNKITFFIQNCNNSNEFISETISPSTALGDVLIWEGELVEIFLGVPVDLAGTYDGIDDAYFSGISLEEKFLDGDTSDAEGENSDDECAFVNMANYMPPQRTSIVGYLHIFGRWYGSNITITGTHTITITGEKVADRFSGADEVYISTPVTGVLITPPSDDCSVIGGVINWALVNSKLEFDADHYVFKPMNGALKATMADECSGLSIGRRYKATAMIKVGTATGAVIRITIRKSDDTFISSGYTINPTNLTYEPVEAEWVSEGADDKIEIEIVEGQVSDEETVFVKDIEVRLTETPNSGTLAVITNAVYTSPNTIITTSNILITQVTGTPHLLTAKKHNNNIVIDTDDIEDVEYKEHKNTAMFTNANGMSFPPGNIKIADRPILRQIKTPTTLSEMRNSLIWFYRNGFTRYIADGDPSTWADATNLKIPQLAGRGLLAEKSLALTDQGILWFAEKGIQLLNGIEPETISRELDIPIKSTYTHWYCSLTKQYGLHDNDFISFTKELVFSAANKTIKINDTTTWASQNIVVGDRFAVSGTANNNKYFTITAINTVTATVSESCTNETISSTVKISKDWVINLETRETTTFRSLDMLSSMSISGGATIDNVIIMLNQYGEIDIYPDYDTGSYTGALSKVKKVIKENYADFVSIMAKYGKASGNVQIKAAIDDPVGDQTGTLAYTDLEDFRTKVLPINFIGNKLTIELRDAETLEYFIVDIGEMLQPI